MPRRIQVDPTLPPEGIPARVLEALSKLALEAGSEECCGLLSGDDQVRFKTVHRCENIMTERHRTDPRAFPRDNTDGFFLSPRDFLAAQDEAASKGERFTAVYHSHVNGGAYFSELDQEFAAQELFPFPNAAHLVIGVSDGRCEFGLFERNRNGGGFCGRLLEPLP